jgi:hypothetical protein
MGLHALPRAVRHERGAFRHAALALCEGGDGAVRDTPAPSYNPRFPSQ